MREENAKELIESLKGRTDIPFRIDGDAFLPAIITCEPDSLDSLIQLPTITERRVYDYAGGQVTYSLSVDKIIANKNAFLLSQSQFMQKACKINSRILQALGLSESNFYEEVTRSLRAERNILNILSIEKEPFTLIGKLDISRDNYHTETLYTMSKPLLVVPGLSCEITRLFSDWEKLNTVYTKNSNWPCGLKKITAAEYFAES